LPRISLRCTDAAREGVRILRLSATPCDAGAGRQSIFDEAFFGPEAETLFLTSMPGPAPELGLGTVVAAAQLKLQAALPAELRDRAARIRDRFYLDAPGWYQDRDRAPP
jgi:hypothetical protein